MHVPVRIGVTSKDEMALPLIISDWANQRTYPPTRVEKEEKEKKTFDHLEMKQLAQHQKKKKKKKETRSLSPYWDE